MRASDPFVWTIRGYQHLISPLTPPMCRFTPTCSHYAAVALREHGMVRGTWLATSRLLRCTPLSAGGYDPVPLRSQTQISRRETSASQLEALTADAETSVTDGEPSGQ